MPSVLISACYKSIHIFSAESISLINHIIKVYIYKQIKITKFGLSRTVTFGRSEGKRE